MNNLEETPELGWLEGSSLTRPEEPPAFPALPPVLTAPRTGDELAYVQRESKSVARFRRWLIAGKAGSTHIYHVGMLLWDRSPLGGRDDELSDLADYVMQAHRFGLAVLVQQRAAPTVTHEMANGDEGFSWGAFEYRAIRTAVPWPGDEAMEMDR